MQRNETIRNRARDAPQGLRVRVLVATIACSLLAAGCGVAADGPIPHGGAGAARLASSATVVERTVDPAKVAGRVVLFTGSSPLEAKIMRRVVRRFEAEHPRIDVQFTAVNRDYPTVVLTRFAGGQAPDVFTVDGKFFADWSSKGLLLPLDGYLQGEQIDMGRYLPTLRESVKGPDARTYALPLNFSTVALFVNDRLLDEAGVEHAPTTWAELEDAANRLTTGDGADQRFGLCLVPTWERMLLFALQQDGGITDIDGTRMLVKSPQTRRAVDWVRHMFDTGAAASPDKVGAQWCGDAFGRGKVAMALEGAWMLPPLRRQYPDVQWSVHPLPVGARAGTLAYSGNMAISSTTRNPDAAWLLLDYLASPRTQSELAKIGVGVPAMTGVEYPQSLAAFAQGIDYATVWSLPAGFFNTVLVTADNEMSAVLEGKQSVAGMLEEIDAIGTTMLAAAQT